MSKKTKDGHVLYEIGDEGAPEGIKDRNGEVVLALCKVCGRGESELDEGPCPGPVSPELAQELGYQPPTDEDKEFAMSLKTNGDILQAARDRLRGMGGYINCLLGDQLNDLLVEHTCFAKAGLHEPIFTLRGQDRLAPKLVRKWAKRAKYRGARKEKVRSAIQTAKDMKSFKGRRYPT